MVAASDDGKAGYRRSGLIPKLSDLDSYYPTLCADDHIENVSQIRHLNGRH
jgi:hypothetical protein